MTRMRAVAGAVRAAVCLCLSVQTARAASPDRQSTAAAVAASNKFGFELYARVKDGGENVICSPVSASIALTMAWAGARGATGREMTRALALPPTEPAQTHAAFASLLAALNARGEKGDVTLQVADRLWAQEGLSFQPAYLRLLSDRYRAPLESVDFARATEQARVTINRWAAVQTHDRIREVLRPGDLSTLTRLVLTNAVYLKATWAVEFAKGHTVDGPFTSPKGEVVAKMMHKTASFRYARAQDLQILELDYRGGLSMVVVLPDAADGLAAAERRLAGSYQAWLKALDFKLIDLKLPRWTVTSRLALSKALSEMGMSTAFSQTADFSGIAKLRPLFIQAVLQQAFVKVDEVGTEAAAVTVVAEGTASKSGSRERPIAFHADHPFLYLIRDQSTGVVLFIGRVVDPR